MLSSSSNIGVAKMMLVQLCSFQLGHSKIINLYENQNLSHKHLNCARAYLRTTVSHCAFSSNLFDGQITQKCINQMNAPENQKCRP